MKGRYPAILEHPQYGAAARELFGHAKEILQEIIDGRLLTARGVYAFWPAASEHDDIIVYKDEDRRAILTRLPMLRQQEAQPDQRPNLSLADYIAPRGSGVPDYIGMFAVTAGIGTDTLVARYEADHDDYRAIIVKALADRLAGSVCYVAALRRLVTTGVTRTRAMPIWKHFSARSIAASVRPLAIRHVPITRQVRSVPVAGR